MTKNKGMIMEQLNISFIGGGNMAEALIAGLCRSGHAANKITVAELQTERRDYLHESYGVDVVRDVTAAAKKADVLVLAVKPQQMKAAVSGLAAYLNENATVMSIAAGVTTESLRAWLGGDLSIVRVMPNTPALVGAGISALFSDAEEIHKQRSEYVLRACGRSVRIDDERQMHAVTALSGSGPAYFFLMAEVLHATGVKLGLPDALAKELAAHTVLGAGKMLAESDRSAEALRHQVSSPGGTTLAALDTMYELGLPDAVRKGVIAASKRSEVLSK